MLAIFDIIFCIILLVGVYKGFTKGFVYTVAITLALVLGIIGSFHLTNKAASYLHEKFAIESAFLPFMSFLLVFAGIVVLIILLAKALEKIIKATALGIPDKIGGAALGAFKMAFYISVVIWLFKPIEKSLSIIPEKQKKESVLFGPISKIAPAVLPTLKDSYRKINQEVEKQVKENE